MITIIWYGQFIVDLTKSDIINLLSLLFMNLTHNKSRDYLVPVNPNINQQQTESVIRRTSREK